MHIPLYRLRVTISQVAVALPVVKSSCLIVQTLAVWAKIFGSCLIWLNVLWVELTSRQCWLAAVPFSCLLGSPGALSGAPCE